METKICSLCKQVHLDTFFYTKILKDEICCTISAPLAEGQRTIGMALCPFIRACVLKLCLRKTSPPELLTAFLPNFTGMYLSWSSFKFLQIIVFHEEF